MFNVQHFIQHIFPRPPACCMCVHCFLQYVHLNAKQTSGKRESSLVILASSSRICVLGCTRLFVLHLAVYCLVFSLLGCLLQSQCTSMPNKRESWLVILANSSRQQLHVDSLDRFCNFCHSVFSNWFDIYYVSARLSSYTSTMKLKTPVLSACSSRFCKHTLQKVLPVQCSLCRSMSTVQIEP